MKDLRISSLFDDIIEGCRDTAATLDSLKSGDGAIRLCYLPQNEFGADQMPWNTCYGDRYEVVARLTEGRQFRHQSRWSGWRTGRHVRLLGIKGRGLPHGLRAKLGDEAFR